MTVLQRGGARHIGAALPRDQCARTIRKVTADSELSQEQSRNCHSASLQAAIAMTRSDQTRPRCTPTRLRSSKTPGSSRIRRRFSGHSAQPPAVGSEKSAAAARARPLRQPARRRSRHACPTMPGGRPGRRASPTPRAADVWRTGRGRARRGLTPCLQTSAEGAPRCVPRGPVVASDASTTGGARCRRDELPNGRQSRCLQ
jgi:hypothetical protein